MEEQRTELAVLKNDLENFKTQVTNELEFIKTRQEDRERTNERWQEQQDKRLEKLEDNDDNLQRDATNNERNKFGLWITIIFGLAGTIIGSVISFILSKM